MFAELRQLGGAIGRPDADGGVLDHVPGAFGLFAVAIAPVPEAAAVGHADATALVDAMSPWATGRFLLNFSEDVIETGCAFETDRYARLREVRHQVDPAGLFLANHEARPAVCSLT